MKLRVVSLTWAHPYLPDMIRNYGIGDSPYVLPKHLPISDLWKLKSIESPETVIIPEEEQEALEAQGEAEARARYEAKERDREEWEEEQKAQEEGGPHE